MGMHSLTLADFYRREKKSCRFIICVSLSEFPDTCYIFLKIFIAQPLNGHAMHQSSFTQVWGSVVQVTDKMKADVFQSLISALI